ncbi:hypothetical protein J2Y65_001259 [Aeromonas salmonicida]|uniref:Uncharacterized protein n=1 Tax=Escherichia coli TaxID=562 RepID=A0A3L0VYD8_ECOLX|nr:hypothetical protein [Aeromonas salmonicida]
MLYVYTVVATQVSDKPFMAKNVIKLAEDELMTLIIKEILFLPGCLFFRLWTKREVAPMVIQYLDEEER